MIDRLETERLILRPPNYDDAPSLNETLADPENSRYSPSAPAPSLAYTQFWIAKCLEARDRDIFTLALFERVRPLRAIGWLQVGLSEEGAELGGALARPFWGSNYATEALRALLGVHPQLGPFWAISDAGNERVARLLESAGVIPIKYLARYRVHPMLSREPRDCILYASDRGRPIR